MKLNEFLKKMRPFDDADKLTLSSTLGKGVCVVCADKIRTEKKILGIIPGHDETIAVKYLFSVEGSVLNAYKLSDSTDDTVTLTLEVASTFNRETARVLYEKYISKHPMLFTVDPSDVKGLPCKFYSKGIIHDMTDDVRAYVNESIEKNPKEILSFT